MINSQSKLFTLKEIINTKDALGCDISSYNDVCIISVTISKVHKTNTDNDGLSVNVATYSGVTRYNAFELDKKYRIVSENESYIIKSFIGGRWSQLQLEVIA